MLSIEQKKILQTIIDLEISTHVEIGTKLFMSQGTLNKNLNIIYSRLNVKNLTCAIVKALKRNEIHL